jgi:gamma-glutamyltranspeptidase/glutathione hydrolase
VSRTGESARCFPAGAVATPHHLASAAGLTTLATGGNAVDAAVAANLVLGVVCPYMCGYGGDLLALVWDGELHAYQGVGRSPEAATVSGVRDRAGSGSMPVFGPHTVTVPGAVDGWFTLLERFGTRSFGDLASTALRYASEGFPLSRRGATFFARCRDLYSYFGLDDFARVYASAAPGEWLAQPALAHTIKALGADGPDTYYRGPIGEAIAARLAESGSFMAPADLANHAGAWVTPLTAPFHDVDARTRTPAHRGDARCARRPRPAPRRPRDDDPRPSFAVRRGVGRSAASRHRPRTRVGAAPVAGPRRRDDLPLYERS